MKLFCPTNSTKLNKEAKSCLCVCVCVYLIFVPVGSDQVLCSCFSGRIRVGGPHWTALVEHLQTTSTHYPKSLYVWETERSISWLTAHWPGPDWLRTPHQCWRRRRVAASVGPDGRLPVTLWFRRCWRAGNWTEIQTTTLSERREKEKKRIGTLPTAPNGPDVRMEQDNREQVLLTDVRFGCQVKDHVDVFCVENVIYQPGVTHISLSRKGRFKKLHLYLHHYY